MGSLSESFENFYNIIIRLRSKDGCPWDREQTAESVKTNLLEEVYECVEAITENDNPHIQEEIGDILLVTGLLARIKEEENAFTFTEAIDKTSEKLIRRHPHVFGDTVVENSAEVRKNWENIKSTVEKKDLGKSKLDGISKSIPPLERAYRFQKKAAKAGFDWENIDGIWEKVYEEIAELKEQINTNASQKDIENELGDILFSVVNLARYLKIDPSIALHGTNEKFLRRFKYVESGMDQAGSQMNRENFEKMDKLWDDAKRLEK